mgnify:CR=1 FL=1
MTQSTEDALTAAVVARMQNAPDARVREVMSALVRHLHGFAREVRLTESEWEAAIGFLTETGQACDATRQEFILLSDTLGLSMQVDAINNQRDAGETPSTVLGPFYVAGAPELEMGSDIAGSVAGGAPTTVSGRVLDRDGRPIPGALLDVWQTAPNGLYDVQDPDQPEFSLRGRFRTGADGAYSFRTVRPVSYPVPTDGPVGRLLQALGRHPYRPAHLHFIVSAPDCERLTTHIFIAGDPYLESDAVFGVKDALIVDLASGPVPGAFAATFDLVMRRSSRSR